jgi:CDP-paratose 2-epimerase
MLEAVALCEKIGGKKLDWTYVEANRIGDHIWYVSDTKKFRTHYPAWEQKYDVPGILEDIHRNNAERWRKEEARR